MWSTTDAYGGVGQPTSAQHFDGIVDPAGWYESVGPNGTPQLVKGIFTDQSGNTISYTPGIVHAPGQRRDEGDLDPRDPVERSRRLVGADQG